MDQQKKHAAALIRLMAILLVTRLAVVFGGYPFLAAAIPEWSWSNNDGYEAIAVNWIRTGVFGLHPGIPTAERLPVYPALIAAACLASQAGTMWLVMFLQALLSAATGYFLFKLTDLVFGRRPALIALLLFILHPQVNNFVFRCATETVFIFLLVMALYQVARFQAEGRTRDIILFALWAGLAVLTRPVLAGLLVFAFPLLVLIGMYNLMSRNFKAVWNLLKVGPDSLVGPSFGRAAGHGGPALPSETDKVARRKAARPNLSARRLFSQIGLAVLLVLVILAPWLARNYIRSGSFPVLQTWVGRPLYQGVYVSGHLSEFISHRKTVAELDQAALVEIRNAEQKFFKGNSGADSRPIAREVMADRHIRELAWNKLLENPLAFAGFFLRNLLLAPVLQMTWRSSAILMAWNWPLLIMALAGMVLCFRKHRPVFIRALPLTIVFGWFLFGHAIAWPQARYILPALVPFSGFAAFALAEIFDGCLRRRDVRIDKIIH